MGIVRKTISMDESQDAWVKAQVASGRFASDSEVYRNIVNQAMEKEAYKKAVLAKIKAGQESGYSNTDFDEIVQKGFKRAETDLVKRDKGAA